jgi:hypothetical protein
MQKVIFFPLSHFIDLEKRELQKCFATAIQMSFLFYDVLHSCDKITWNISWRQAIGLFV